MPTLINHRRITDNDWTTLDAESTLPETGRVILPWDRWLLEQDTLRHRHGLEVGVLVNGDVPVHELGPLCEAFSLIALEFPAATDGRCYSHASVLRTEYGYTGELRAVGDVRRDQLAYMERVGINAYLLPGDEAQARDALGAFVEFSVHYQNAAPRSLPRIKRRLERAEAAA